MAAAIRIAYRHLSGCPSGDCPGHVAVLRRPSDVERIIRTLAQGHSERPVEVERVTEIEA